MQESKGACLQLTGAASPDAAVGEATWGWHAGLTTDNIVRLGVIEAKPIERGVPRHKAVRAVAHALMCCSCTVCTLLPKSRWGRRSPG